MPSDSRNDIGAEPETECGALGLFKAGLAAWPGRAGPDCALSKTAAGKAVQMEGRGRSHSDGRGRVPIKLY